MYFLWAVSVWVVGVFLGLWREFWLGSRLRFEQSRDFFIVFSGV